MRESILITGGTLVDGTGSKPYLGDLLLKGGRILAVGNLQAVTANQVIDATGKVVSPGFIDTHVHSDLDLLIDPDHISGLSQGITTEILGQDGLSYAPLSPDNLADYGRYLEGLNGPLPQKLTWTTVAELRELFRATTAINTLYQVPHGALRLETVGWADVPLQGADLKEAQDLLAQGFEEGAVAFSTGLSYYPCSYADTRELIELCQVAAAYKRPYVTHLRTVFPERPFDAVQEAIAIARASGASLHISHFRTTPETAGKVGEMLAPIEAALDEGVDITLETYPYPAGAGFTMVMLPRYAHTQGAEGLMARLANPHMRGRMANDMVEQGLLHDGIFTYLPPGPDQKLVGQTIFQTAAERNIKPAELVLDLMFRNQLAVGYMQTPPERARWLQIEEDIRQLIQKPYYMVGSDSLSAGLQPHPRTYGTFPKFLRWQREHDFMPLEALIQRMTSLPASRFGLSDRGELKPGKAGDVVIFDPKIITDRATYQQPKAQAKGIAYVFVNGVMVFQHGKSQGVYPGIPLP